jgi:hypothetical protein
MGAGIHPGRKHTTEAPWAIKHMRYMTNVRDYVDVDALMITMYGMSTFAQLQFANHSALINGTDLYGSAVGWNSLISGLGMISAVVGWLH